MQTALPPSRPLLRPAVRWARWALVFLLAFTFLRGAVWAVTIPSWYGPDEDYHFLYVENLTMRGEIPDRGTKLYSEQYSRATDSMRYNAYGQRPRADFGQDQPKRSVRELEGLSDAQRTGTDAGRGVGVVHPPLYHAAGWTVNTAPGNASTFTRYTALKWMTSLFGVLAVYAAWLLAAQFFRQEPLRLLAAFLVAVQPMAGFLSGIVNHDMLLIATMTLATAMLLFLLRSPPRARQGLWVGIPIALALLTKSPGLALIPLALLAYGVQWLIHRDRGREVLRSMGLAGIVILIGAGWWYLGAAILGDGTVTGQVSPAPSPLPSPPTTLDLLWSLTKEWTSHTYRTYWFHHYNYEAPRSSPWFFVPMVVGAVALLGLVAFVVRRRRDLLAPDRPQLRQAALLAILAFGLYLPLLAVDIQHWFNGQGFYMTGGRYLLPAFPGIAVLVVAGFRELALRRTEPFVLAGLALVAAAFCWKVWITVYLHRYYGPEDVGWSELLRRMSFDRPEFVTPTTLRIALALMFASLIAAALCAIPPVQRGASALARRSRRGSRLRSGTRARRDAPGRM